MLALQKPPWEEEPLAEETEDPILENLSLGRRAWEEAS